ncbi:hypothetical protein BC936DRAFT_148175 [Jimgerdemannia flammicorona]|uniref:Uncharacterized protein n=1 Tax=Jimgerdemannia flammicorona TaxID=994334 RepID=A0A433D3P4_9FUNG|nr:hypothetical protein BC936DRAFT_148175 [Jimgerdemannia flammicorona]
MDLTCRAETSLQQIVNEWKDWVAPLKLKCENVEKYELERSRWKVEMLQAEKQVLATGNAIIQMDVIQKKFADASRPTIRKHIQDEKVKTEDKGAEKQPLVKKVRLDIDDARSIDTSDANSDKEGDRRHVTICKEQPEKVGIKLNMITMRSAFTMTMKSSSTMRTFSDDLPEECEVEVELGKAKVEQDWKKWSADLRQAAKKSVHDHCPENRGIIRCGPGIRCYNWMSKKLYQVLQSSLTSADGAPFTEYSSYITDVVLNQREPCSYAGQRPSYRERRF